MDCIQITEKKKQKTGVKNKKGCQIEKGKKKAPHIKNRCQTEKRKRPQPRASDWIYLIMGYGLGGTS